MTATGEAKQTRKAVNYEMIPRKDSLVHKLFDQLVRGHPQRFDHLKAANVAFCSHLNLTPGPDGAVNHGKVVVLSDFQREFMVDDKNNRIDAIIVLNKEWWNCTGTDDEPATTDPMRLGNLSHLMLQIETRVGIDGEQKTDERGRPLWRKRGPDLAIFKEEISDGAWNDAQQDIYEAVLEFKDGLFDPMGRDSTEPAGAIGDGEGDSPTKDSTAAA